MFYAEDLPAPHPARVVVGNIPQEPPAFQLREDLMTQLRAVGPGMTVVRSVTGMRGVGKTQLAAAYARECVEAGWRLVAWVDASDQASVLAGLAQVALFAGVGPAGEDAARLALMVRRWLEADGEQRLLVFDNLGDPDALLPFLPAAGAARVVITSNRQLAGSLAPLVPVDVFTSGEARTFLAERTGLSDPSGAAALAEELGHLPLALALAAAAIVQGRLTYQDYLSRLRALTSDHLKVAAAPYPHDIAQTVLLSADAAADADKSGRGAILLDLISVLSPEGVPRALLYKAGSAGLVAASLPQDIDVALGQLADASLLSFTTDGAEVSVHRLVSRVIRERHASDGTLIPLGSSAIELLTLVQLSLPEPWRDRSAAWDFVRQVNALFEHLVPYLSSQDTELVTKLLRLRSWAVRYLLDLDENAPLAVALAEPLLADRGRVLGESDPDTLASLNDLASAYLAAGRVAEAVPLYERALADRGRVLGESDPDTLASLNDLASAYLAAGRVAEAVPLYERALADFALVLGQSHPATLGAQDNLALAYLTAGRVAEAVPLLESAMADRQRVLGESHPDTLRSRGNLASAYQAAGRVAEAVPLYERALMDRERVLGESHPDTLASKNNLASAYEAVGRVAEAVPLYEAALADYARVLGESHPATLRSRGNLASAYQAAGRVAEAVPLLEAVLAGRERVLGESHPDTLRSRGNLASAYRDAGRITEAVPWLETALTRMEQVLGPDHPDTVLVRKNLNVARHEAHR
jgi:tetratricopeptide (TPR) repeat protein